MPWRYGCDCMRCSCAYANTAEGFTSCSSSIFIEMATAVLHPRHWHAAVLHTDTVQRTCNRSPQRTGLRHWLQRQPRARSEPGGLC